MYICTYVNIIDTVSCSYITEEERFMTQFKYWYSSFGYMYSSILINILLLHCIASLVQIIIHVFMMIITIIGENYLTTSIKISTLFSNGLPTTAKMLFCLLNAKNLKKCHAITRSQMAFIPHSTSAASNTKRTKLGRATILEPGTDQSKYALK